MNSNNWTMVFILVLCCEQREEKIETKESSDKCQVTILLSRQKLWKSTSSSSCPPFIFFPYLENYEFESKHYFIPEI